MRLFESPAKQDGRAFVQALTAEMVNNHQAGCSLCGLQYLVHDASETSFNSVCDAVYGYGTVINFECMGDSEYKRRGDE